MARNNPTWGEERIAADLLLKLGIRVSLRTGRRDMPNGARGRDGPSSQRWRIVVRPHTKAMDQGQAWLLGSLGREEDFCSIGGPGDRHQHVRTVRIGQRYWAGKRNFCCVCRRLTEDPPAYPGAKEVLADQCVQPRLACSVGVSPTGGIVRTPVARVASVEETKRTKPTDKAILGMVSESPGRNASEPTSGLEKK